jgi:glycosyltransferase involved in cell wall biosynthesis
MFKPYQNRDLLPLSLNIADVHWVTLDPKMEGFIVPSKFYGILAAGKPVIFIGDRDGEIARDIRKGECGESVIIGNYKRLEEIIKQYSNNVTLLSALGQNSRKLFEKKYQFHISAVKFYNLLTDIGRNIQ